MENWKILPGKISAKMRWWKVHVKYEYAVRVKAESGIFWRVQIAMIKRIRFNDTFLNVICNRVHTNTQRLPSLKFWGSKF